ncbi:hypothetical protein GCM10025768_11560 [Microbacterium pseudoresistens]|uniref:Membrane associated rhomboid family serine protease n=1 Tax=Microbacterium pseudoresistens TaxID=640634 RepID=A0A7Y9JPV3_9MICO|nr:hypothetical protein [Microbacterium pseudoresistens]NYD55059.1 membrane associated rhomboid family serine protease [Microbacterium pseudoresistens]
MSPSPVSSTPILRRTLIVGGIAAILLAIVAAVIGGLVAGANGMWSGLAGVLLAVVFLAITGISILVANRWYGDPLYVQFFFAIVLGGWLLKLALFVVIMLVLRGQPWISPLVFFLSIVAGVVMSLVVDVVVLMKMRLPHVSDISLPTSDPEDESDPQGAAGRGEQPTGDTPPTSPDP